MAWIGTVVTCYHCDNIVCLPQGTGLLRVYDSKHYFLESDTKITDTRQRTGARLVCAQA